VFRVFYSLYRLIHLLLTGVPVRVGNFSAVPAAYLKRLALLSEMWNHYAAAVFKSRIPYRTVPTHRAPRLAGRSRMNFVSLVAHGLSAISVFSEVVGVRLLLATGLFVAGAVLALFALLAAVLVMGLMVPTWAYQLIGLLALLLVQCLVLGVLFVLVILSGRSASGFLPVRPVRDYGYFIDGFQALYHAPLSREGSGRVTEQERVRSA
jgi:hypothetical protein